MVGTPDVDSRAGAVWTITWGFSANIPQPAEQADALFGFAIAGGGDVDGDGYADMIVGAPGEAAIYVIRGGAGGADTPQRFFSSDAVGNLGMLVDL